MLFPLLFSSVLRDTVLLWWQKKRKREKRKTMKKGKLKVGEVGRGSMRHTNPYLKRWRLIGSLTAEPTLWK